MLFGLFPSKKQKRKLKYFEAYLKYIYNEYDNYYVTDFDSDTPDSTRKLSDIDKFHILLYHARDNKILKERSNKDFFDLFNIPIDRLQDILIDRVINFNQLEEFLINEL